jgi:hypothetical protein
VKRVGVVLVVWVWLVLAARLPAAGLPLGAASGVVSKATANVLFIYPQDANGELGPKMVLKLRGTSNVYLVTTHVRARQPVVVQRAIDPRSLAPNQPIAVIYTATRDEYILLSAVAQQVVGR